LHKAKGSYSAVFKGVKRKLFLPKIQSGIQPSILQGDCITKNISIWSIYISLRVIELRKVKGSYSAVFKKVKRKLFSENSIWNPARNLTGRLHHEKYFNLGHKHLALGNRVAESEGLQFGRFQGSKKETFFLPKIQSGIQPSILQGDCITKNISIWGINISLNIVAESQGFLFGRFQGSKKKTFLLKIQSGIQSSILQGDCITKNISIWGINISLRPGNRVAESEGFLFGRFQESKKEIFC
jgi:hypothetical protein